ncbi:protein related to CSI2 protein [Hirsutella rhossiliensis]|uniref:Proteinrelated to CSI2 protein n=1 Tax=Hirsutella rhossiliensis TaxID=111463 RepID=A0A9P8N1V6_9HYPO|nr:proteinrelated to CSI2 protein [Hirsutella rhossiliensis]KAH0965077.1 proteinrelated to CSI2 protein [Hirsutella rhossiliensis]
MQPTGFLSWSAFVLSTLGFVTIFSAPVMAQAGGNSRTPSPRPAGTPIRSNAPSPSRSDRQVATPTTTADDSTSTTDDNTSTTGTDRVTDFPTLTRGGAIPTYPPPSVPPTKNAPFMQHSNLPDGTVFIAVGAILGAFGLAILLWRSIVSLLLHRSVKRAAMAQHTTNSKAGFPAPPAPFYKYTDQDSSMSLAPGAGPAAGRGVRRTNRGPIPSATPSHSNLFFSPTAISTAGPRASTYLPSGFYASGAGSPAGNQTNTIGLQNLRPDSRGQDANNMSTSSLHLNTAAPGQRAPSAYLEDLLADDPGALPPPHMPLPNGPSGTSPGSRANSLHNRM